MLKQIQDILPDGMDLFGVAVGNAENGEGAMILEGTDRGPHSRVYDCDVLLDVHCDAEHAYSHSVERLYKLERIQ